jgi:hypothetical protein
MICCGLGLWWLKPLQQSVQSRLAATENCYQSGKLPSTSYNSSLYALNSSLPCSVKRIMVWGFLFWKVFD